MSWPDSAALLNEPLTEAELLFVYFVLSNSGHYGRQSLSLTLHNSHHAVTLSLEQKLARQESDTVADILGDLTGIACTVFDTSVLVCGPELDLHGVENELDMLNIEKVLVKDLRCWTAICMRSFPRRERDFDLFTREPIA